MRPHTVIEPLERIPFPYMGGRYQFNEKRGYVWLQKLLFWCLDKIGCEIEEMAYKTRVIDADKFIKRLLAAESEVAAQIGYRQSPATLIIGSEDYAELMREEGFRHMVDFNAEYNYSNGRATTVCGMRVTIVPWMRGMVVLP